MNTQYKFGRGYWRTIEEGNERLWMIGNGIGGYANGTIIDSNASVFHGYLIASLNPPVSRVLVLSNTQEEIDICGRKYDLTSQQYINYERDGYKNLDRFVLDTVPEFYYRTEDVTLKKSIALEYGHNTVVICYEVEGGIEDAELKIVPLFNYKVASDAAEKSDLNFDINVDEVKGAIYLTPKKNKDITIKCLYSDGTIYDRDMIPKRLGVNYLMEENTYLMQDNRTGFLGLDNHYTPYEIRVSIKAHEKKKFYIKCTIEDLDDRDGFEILQEYKDRSDNLVKESGFEDDFMSKLIKSADNFIVDRNSTKLKTILAGYPWFTDWGRDTMIAFEGLVLVPKRYKEAREILASFAKYIKNGLVPNLFPDENTPPQYNTVDASLWYFQAVYKYMKYLAKEESYDLAEDNKFIKEVVYQKLKEIIDAYARGTDFSIYMDEDDCLIHSGSGLDQVTWMDVRVGDIVVTPRHGKAVEINALWYNALKIMSILSVMLGDDLAGYKQLADKVKISFNQKFWNEEKNCLYDVVDEDDDSIRPNQLWAVSLPFSILDSPEKEKAIVETCYKHLYSTYGMRSLSFLDKNYKPKYIGKLFDRDMAYHMGTTWGFLIGPFITAYCKVNNYSKSALDKAESMCKAFEDHLNDGCIGGIAEIFDGDFASTSRGCYSQAWSVGEVIRVYSDILEHKKELI